MTRVEDRANALHASIEVRTGAPRSASRALPCRRDTARGGTTTGVVHPPQVVGFVCLQQSLEKVGDAPRGRGVFAATGGQRAGNEGEKRAIDQRVAVDEEKARRRRKVLEGVVTL